MTRRAGHTCNPPCDERHDAMMVGTFKWMANVGYVRTDIPLRTRMVKFQHVMDGALINGVVPQSFGYYVFDTCCYCGGDLDRPE